MKRVSSIKYFWQVLCLFLLLMSGVAVAEPPVSMLQTVANRMVAQLDSNKANLSASTIRRIINTTLVPYIDVNRMAGMVVGRTHWRSASPSQRATFVRQFKRLVINTYSSALASYNGDNIKFYPLRTGVTGSFARVKSVIIRRNGHRIGIDYNLIKRNGRWKIYDFSIEGVSIVRNYRSQFSGTLAHGGVLALIERLRKHIRRG